MENEVKFYLEKRKDKQTGKLIVENVPIYLFYSYNGNRLQYYTGLRVAHADHFGGKEVIKGNREETQKINKELIRLEAKVLDIAEKARVNNEELTNEIFKEKLRGEGISIKSGKKSFHEALEEFYLSSSLCKSEATVVGLKSAFEVYKTFSKETRTRLEYNVITQEFYERFLQWCFSKGWKNNYTGKLIKDLKTFLNWTTEKGYNSNLDFRKKSFKKLKEEPEIVFLTWEELMKLHKYSFRAKQKDYSEIRDIFCFACFTGMRHSDVAALEKGNVFKEDIRYRIEKTEKSNTIPLNPYTKEIIARYKKLPGDKLLPCFTLQTINDKLKELFKVVKLKRKVQQTHFQGAKAIKTVMPLYDFVTFHIAKKTFMTNFLAKGGSLLTAMSITGNKDFKTARRYYTVVDSLKKVEMKKVFG